jgi:hypothetical protein
MVSGGGTPVLPRAVDAQGRIYFSMRNIQNFRDSSRVGRLTSGSNEVETLAKYKPRQVRRSGGGGQISMQQVPMSLEDDWAVGRTGPSRWSGQTAITSRSYIRMVRCPWDLP